MVFAASLLGAYRETARVEKQPISTRVVLLKKVLNGFFPTNVVDNSESEQFNCLCGCRSAQQKVADRARAHASERTNLHLIQIFQTSRRQCSSADANTEKTKNHFNRKHQEISRLFITALI